MKGSRKISCHGAPIAFFSFHCSIYTFTCTLRRVEGEGNTKCFQFCSVASIAILLHSCNQRSKRITSPAPALMAQKITDDDVDKGRRVGGEYKVAYETVE